MAQVSSMPTPDGFIKLEYLGALKISELVVRKTEIILVQKPTSEKFGCIVETQADKYPVANAYEQVLDALNFG